MQNLLIEKSESGFDHLMPVDVEGEVVDTATMKPSLCVHCTLLYGDQRSDCQRVKLPVVLFLYGRQLDFRCRWQANKWDVARVYT